MPAVLFGMGSSQLDTCSINDICSTAIEIPVSSDLGFYCLEGCTTDATAEWFNNPCGIGYSRTVWYKVVANNFARVMNINVQSDSISFINISLFLSVNGCDPLEQVLMTSNNVACVQGYNGSVKAIGTRINTNSIYYIAVTDVNDVGGTFELCVNTLSFGYRCVTDRKIEITGRSSGEALEGPYYPGERISICFNINSYSAANNDCQFLQGIIPVFGNGWDPASFDANGQPINTTLNGNMIGSPGNGNYGSATWDWFTDVDYHYNNPYLQVADLDDNGTVDMCSLLCDPWCANIHSFEGSCCNPCWGNPLGTILPGGWLAYGNNGLCPTPGPPIRVDAGDGINCENGMGPWKFCFDLYVRDFPDCKYDKTTTDLTLGFFTTTDVETGSTSANPIICNDLPTYLTPGLQCRQFNNDLGTSTLDDVCSGDVVSYTLNIPGVDYWEWTVTPSANVKDSVFHGENGHILKSYPVITGTSPVVIKYNVIGRVDHSNEVIYKTIQYRAWPEIQYQLPNEVKICEHKPGTILISPTNVTGGKPPLHYLWSPNGDTLQSLILNSPFQAGNVYLSVFDTIGCITKDSVQIKLKSCDFDEMHPGDAPNDTITPQPQSPQDGNFSNPIVKRSFQSTPDPKNFEPVKLFPTPTIDLVTLNWSFDLHHDASIEIFNTQGFGLMKISVKANEGHGKQIDIQSLASGIYFVRFSNEDFRFVNRLIKI